MKHRVFRVETEPEKHKRALLALASTPWATGLLVDPRRGTATPGALFELRFAYELHLSGLSPVRPFRAGVGSTDIDFRVPHKRPWNIELLSLKESDAITRARVVDDNADGVRIESLDLGLIGKDDEDERRRLAQQTPEHDMRRMIKKLGEKVCDDSGRPRKFPVPDGTFINMLLVDVRTYLGGDGSIDWIDCRQILYGPRAVSPELVAFDASTGEPYRGLWDPTNRTTFSQVARERLQVVGFVHEEEFTDDEIRQVTRLYAAPGSQVDLADNPMGWPLRSSDNTGLRAENALWNLG